MNRERILILGAAGRDFHDFSVVFAIELITRLWALLQPRYLILHADLIRLN
ncbi:MAG: hypothetical protein MUO26_15870 [Methanotrichaceae archaeon]|nr:hypothetical protein [Methanotrichaceae archaeon]